eukprot:152762_1
MKPENESSAPQKFCCWLLSSCIAIIFILLDRIESGQMEYLYVNLDLTQTNTNTFRCGFKTITLHCPVNDVYSTNVCSTLVNMHSAEKYATKININTSYDSYHQLYAYLFYICTCIGCVIPWMLSTGIFFCEPKYGNKKFLCCTSQTKCFIFCLLSMITSIAAVVFGTLIITNDECSDRLYQFIVGALESNIQYYPTFNQNDITIWFGATIIFMMINAAITFTFAVYCGNGAKHHEALKNKLQNRCFSFKVKLKSKFTWKKEKKLEIQFPPKQTSDKIQTQPFKGLLTLSPCDEKRTKP